MQNWKSIFLIVLLALPPLWARPVKRSVPGKYSFAVNENQSGLQEQDINELLQMLDQEFASQIHNTSKPWFAGFNWQQAYLGAGSTFDGQDFSIMLWGGLLRAKYMTYGAAAAVVCHELGHRLGGAPFQKFPGEEVDWSSAEGQADRFAANECLPKLFARLKQSSSRFLLQKVEASTKELCRPSREPQKCEWVATSGIELIQALQVYFDINISFAEPEKAASERPEQTLSTSYPSYQCRMDTYRFGARDPRVPRLPCWFVQ